MNKIAKKIILSVLSVTALTTTSALAADLSGWAVSEYQSANEAGLVSYSVVSNNLKDNITREEFCELAVNLYKKLTNETLITPETSPFSDTDNIAISQAYYYGIVSGTDDNTFTPYRLVTREEMAKMLVSTLTAGEADFKLSDGSDESAIEGFDDADEISSWAKASVITSLNYSLMNGITDTDLEPLTSTTREQAIASINRSYNQFKEYDYSIQLPEITLPEDGAEIEEGDFNVSWTPHDDAYAYHVIIKDSDANSVVLTDVYDGYEVTIKKGALKPNHTYSITVGAVLEDQTEIYSMPVDFNYIRKASSGLTTAPSKNYTADSPVIQNILDTATQYLGLPYIWGGSTPAGFDCSGFVQYVYKQNGYSITRTTYTQWDNDGVSVKRSDLQPGDLIYFGSGGSPTHVGLYVGDGMMIHSPKTGDVIKYSTIESGYYNERYMGARRIVN